MRLREDRARELFHEFDTNKDGVIDMDELKEMSKALELDKDEDLRNRMEEEFMIMDVDGSGGVDFPEFVTYYNKMLQTFLICDKKPLYSLLLNRLQRQSKDLIH